MDDVITSLHDAEKEHLMAVLSRDRILREKETERVTLMRIGLVRERKAGALVVDRKYKGSSSSRCARCLTALTLAEKMEGPNARCCICKHLVCSRCRVLKWSRKSATREEALNSDDKTSNDFFAKLKTSITQPLFTSTPVREKLVFPNPNLNGETMGKHLTADHRKPASSNAHETSLLSGWSTDASLPVNDHHHITSEKSHLPLPLPRRPLTGGRSGPDALSAFKRKQTVDYPGLAEEDPVLPASNPMNNRLELNTKKERDFSRKTLESISPDPEEEEKKITCHCHTNPFVDQHNCEETEEKPFSYLSQHDEALDNLNPFLNDSDTIDLIKDSDLDSLNPFLQSSETSEESAPNSASSFIKRTSVSAIPTPAVVSIDSLVTSAKNQMTENHSLTENKRKSMTNQDVAMRFLNMAGVRTRDLSVPRNPDEGTEEVIVRQRSTSLGPMKDPISTTSSWKRRFTVAPTKNGILGSLSASFLKPSKSQIAISQAATSAENERSKNPLKRHNSYNGDVEPWWRKSLNLKRPGRYLKAGDQDQVVGKISNDVISDDATPAISTLSSEKANKSISDEEMIQNGHVIPGLPDQSSSSSKQILSTTGSSTSRGTLSSQESAKHITGDLSSSSPIKPQHLMNNKKFENGSSSYPSMDDGSPDTSSVSNNNSPSLHKATARLPQKNPIDVSEISPKIKSITYENPASDTEEGSTADESGFSSNLSDFANSCDVSSDAIAGDADDSDGMGPTKLLVLSTVSTMLGRSMHSIKKERSKKIARKRRKSKPRKVRKKSRTPGVDTPQENPKPPPSTAPIPDNDKSTSDAEEPSEANEVQTALFAKMTAPIVTKSIDNSPESTHQAGTSEPHLTDETTVALSDRAFPNEEKEERVDVEDRLVTPPSISNSFLSLFNSKIRANELWICRICDKTIDLQKKSGDWFHKASSPASLHYKRSLFDTKRPISRLQNPALSVESSKGRQTPPNFPLAHGSPHRIAMRNNRTKIAAITNTTYSGAAEFPNNSRSRTASDAKCPEKTRSNSSQNIADFPKRSRSRTMPPEMLSKNYDEYRKGRLIRYERRLSKKSISEAMHASLRKYVAEPLSPEDGTSKTKFVKKKSSKEITSCEPAVITDGPKDTVVIRGNPISLYCNLGGTSPFKVVWRKGRNEIKHSSQCNIETSTNASALTIRQSQRDDSGCYTLQVTNAGGVDQYSVSVKVVDVPDPPGKPFVEPSSNNSMVMSWYGSAYDGGSSVLAYIVEMAKVKDGNHKDCKRWTEVSTTKSTSHTATNLEQNAAFMFRVSAQNEHGTSKPGPASDIARNLAVVENGENSTDEEEEGAFVKYGPVVVKHNEKFSSKYDTREKLGQGRFGKVHRVIDRSTSKPYAAKIMRALKAKDKEAVALEIEIMNSLRHPKLVQLVDAYIQGREVTMVMDLVAGGELFERVIDEDFELTEAACIKYMRQICDGVRFMHDSMIVHLDLKPENIMCINKTGTQIKLIDFGLARRFNPKEPIRVMFGTPEFVAPEVIDYDTIGFQTDMWSVGVICYILLSGLSPFSGDNDQQTLSNITAVRWDFDDEAFDQISDDAKDFISNLLVHSLKSRYTVEKALEHRWLKKDTKKMKTSKLNTKNLKRFLARRKWQKTGNAVRALQRLGALAGIGTAASASNGQQRESGFLSALKAQLIREKDEEEHDKRKPEFIETFDDVEVIEGSAARFQCTIIGKPDPEIMWYMDGEPIKESRHFRISYNEDDVCTLLITEATEADEAEYTCTAMNSEGEVTHSAELIVITPGV